ncbi:hypothetical protein H0X06_01760 [Candidatus Dependentiae bacterium]|nr:hypothetical protein [Candidatus Dependentiae bacterium]
MNPYKLMYLSLEENSCRTLHYEHSDQRIGIQEKSSYYTVDTSSYSTMVDEP